MNLEIVMMRILVKDYTNKPTSLIIAFILYSIFSDPRPSQLPTECLQHMEEEKHKTKEVLGSELNI